MKLKVPLAIETPRLILRPPDSDNAQQMYEAIRDSLESLRPWMAWAQALPAVETVRQKTAEARQKMERREFFQWRMFLRESDLLVGAIDLHHWDWSIPKYEIGYWGRHGYVGRGLVTEAVTAVMATTVERFGVRRIEAMCDARNQASQRLALRAGLVREALLRDYELDVEGKPCDQVRFAWLAP